VPLPSIAPPCRRAFATYPGRRQHTRKVSSDISHFSVCDFAGQDPCSVVVCGRGLVARPVHKHGEEEKKDDLRHSASPRRGHRQDETNKQCVERGLLQHEVVSNYRTVHVRSDAWSIFLLHSRTFTLRLCFCCVKVVKPRNVYKYLPRVYYELRLVSCVDLNGAEQLGACLVSLLLPDVPDHLLKMPSGIHNGPGVALEGLD
jgi:hypothetical protein